MKLLLSILNIFLLVYITPSAAEITCSKDTVCMEIEKEGNVVSFFVINKKQHKSSVMVDVNKTNMSASEPLPIKIVLNGEERRFVFSLEHGNKSWKYNYHYDWARGDHTAVHNSHYVYDLPYAKESKFKVVQSCNGSFSHTGQSQYAIDFKMPVDTQIHAAREGVVVDVKSNSTVGGNSRSYIDDANYVVIEHDDGTLGEYFHLKTGGSSVSLGQAINKGELIGYSGNTGYTSGPHLHFVVKSANDQGESISFPFKFSTKNGVVSCPKKNTLLLN